MQPSLLSQLTLTCDPQIPALVTCHYWQTMMLSNIVRKDAENTKYHKKIEWMENSKGTRKQSLFVYSCITLSLLFLFLNGCLAMRAPQHTHTHTHTHTHNVSQWFVEKERKKSHNYFTFSYEFKTNSNIFFLHICEFILIICGVGLDEAGMSRVGYLLTENLLPLHILVLAVIMW